MSRTTRAIDPNAPAGLASHGRELSRAASLWYDLTRNAAHTFFWSGGGISASGKEHIPSSGGCLLVSNHLSYLDVFAMGVTCPRPLCYVARSTLFVFPLGALIRSVGGFPIQREGLGASGLKETLRRLRENRIILFFPEGTRTRDGDLGEIKPGIANLAIRAGVPILPAAIAGTFEAWPRHRPKPVPYPVHVHFGERIDPAAFPAADPGVLTREIESQILASQRIARERVAQSMP